MFGTEKIKQVAPIAGLIFAILGGLFFLMSSEGSDSGADLQRIVAVPQAELDYFEPREDLKYESKVVEKYAADKSNPASSEVFTAPKFIPPSTELSPTAPIPPTSNIEMRTSFLGLMFRLFESAFK